MADYTYENVMESTRAGTFFLKHPFTGENLVEDIPLRVKVLSLTSFYTAIVTTQEISVYYLLAHVMPIVLFGCTLGVIVLFAQKLFQALDFKFWLFMSSILIFFIATMRVEYLPGNYLFYAGYTGESFRNLVLIPLVVYAMWQRKYILLVLALIVEPTLVWTGYGIGGGSIVAILMFLVDKILKGKRRGA